MSKTPVIKVVQDFMLKENRPYAVNDVVEKCGKDLGKANIQKSLDALVNKQILVGKIFGKHKIYFPQQKLNTAELKKNTLSLKQKLSQAQNNLKSNESRLKELDSKLKSLKKIKSLTTLTQERDQLLEAIQLLKDQLKRHQSQEHQQQYTGQDVRQIEAKYETVSTAYRKRKRMCNDMLDAIMEGYPKTKKSLITDIGLETDEEVGFKL